MEARLSILFVLSGFTLILGCSPSDSGSSKLAVDTYRAEDVLVESVNCKALSFITFKSLNGIKTIESHSVGKIVKKTLISPDGKLHKSFRSGEWTHTSDVKSENPHSYGYTFVSQREYLKTEIEPGTFKEVGNFKTTNTGKDGYEFRDLNGVNSVIQVREGTFEKIYREIGNKRIEISENVSGQSQDSADYEVTISVNGNVRTEKTVLKDPISYQQENDEITNDRYEEVCTFEKI